jgi:hypothetical protein
MYFFYIIQLLPGKQVIFFDFGTQNIKLGRISNQTRTNSEFDRKCRIQNSNLR